MMEIALQQQFNDARTDGLEDTSRLIGGVADVAEETLVPDQLDALRALGKLHKILEAAK